MSITGATPLAGLRFKRDVEEKISLLGTQKEIDAAREYLQENGYEFRSGSDESPQIYATLTMARTVYSEGTMEA